ncbi:hypothetical protein ACQ5SP_14740 [Rhodovulum sp. YNF3179]
MPLLALVGARAICGAALSGICRRRRVSVEDHYRGEIGQIRGTNLVKE